MDTTREPDLDTNFYYLEHQPFKFYVVDILEEREQLLRVKITGKLTDINYYTGTKPDTVLQLEGWYWMRF